MNRKQAKEKRRRHTVKFAAAWATLITVELLAAVTPAALFAAVAIPFAYEQRGYSAFGSEWIITAGIFCVAYSVIHGWVCEKIFGKRRSR